MLLLTRLYNKECPPCTVKQLQSRLEKKTKTTTVSQSHYLFVDICGFLQYFVFFQAFHSHLKKVKGSLDDTSVRVP